MRRLESVGASIATLILLFPVAAGFAVAAAIGAGGSAWLALALGAVVGAVAGCALALRRWNDPYVGGSIRGGIGAGVIGGIVASQVHALPVSVKAAIWGAIAALYVPAIVELVHRRGLGGR
jgi:outer membrane lipoprotein SlyB